MAHQLPHHAVARPFRDRLHGVSDVPDIIPVRACAIPAARHSCVTCSSRSASGVMGPTASVVAESACSPSSWTPTSTLTMLPSFSTRRLEGMP